MKGQAMIYRSKRVKSAKWARSLNTFVLALLCYLGIGGCSLPRLPKEQKEQFRLPDSSALDEQYLPDGSVPPYRERYSLPSVRALSSEALWKFIVDDSDGVVIVGVKDRQPRGYFRGKVLVDAERVREIQAAVERQLGGRRPTGRSDTSLPVMADGHRWPAFFARLRTIDELSALRKLPNIDFIEPARFRFLDSSSCTRNDYKAKALGSTDEQFHLDAAAGQIEASGIYDLVPYTFQHMGIVSAWRRLIYGTGPGYGYPGA